MAFKWTSHCWSPRVLERFSRVSQYHGGYIGVRPKRLICSHPPPCTCMDTCISPHSSYVNLLKLPAAMKHYPRKDIPVPAPSDASPRPFLGHTDLNSLSPCSSTLAVRRFPSSKQTLGCSWIQLCFHYQSILRVSSPCSTSRDHLGPHRKIHPSSHMRDSKRLKRDNWKPEKTQSLTRRSEDLAPTLLQLCYLPKMRPQARMGPWDPALSSWCGGTNRRIKTRRIL